MRFTNKFPYTNINNINLDWIIKRVKELGETVLSYAQDIANAVAQADAAQEAADSVTGTAESALATAQAAEATANAIAGTANNALTTAQAAETTAQAAETTANAIAGTANTALTTAQAAETTAQAAETSAQTAEESASNAETIAGTASANASNAVQTASTALATAQTALSIASQFDMSVLNEKAGALNTTESGTLVSFLPDRTIEQDLSISVNIEPAQDLHGFDNPWPAGGGKNKFALPDGAVVKNGMTLKWQNGVFTIYAPNTTSGEVGAGDSAWKGFGYCTLPAGSYTFYTERPTVAGSLSIYLINYDTGDRIVSDKNTGTFTFTLASETNVYLGFYMLGAQCTTESEWKVGVFLTSEYTGYSPYSNECPIYGWDAVSVWNKPTHDTTLPPTVEIQLGQTVYGGTLDVTAGTLTVDRAMVDLGTLTWLYRNGLFDASISGGKLKGYATGEAKAICSEYAQRAKAYTQLIDGEMAFGTGYVNGANCSAILKNSKYTSAATFKTAMNGVQLCYELATPFTITLDPATIATIVGQTNNVWANAGNVSVAFAADLKWYIDTKDEDLKLYVDNKIAELQALALENGG